MIQKVFPNWWQAICIWLVFMLFLFLSEIISRYIIVKNISSYYVSLSYLVFLVFEIPFLWWMYKKAGLKITDQIRIPTTKLILLIIMAAIIFAIVIRPLGYPMEYYRAIFHNDVFVLPHSNFSETSFPIILNRLLIYCIAGPIIEEIVNRGLIMEQWLKKYSPVKTIFFMASIFALMHLTPSSGAHFLFGCLIGILYYFTRSLFLSIVFHIVYNIFINVLAFTYGKYGDWFYSIEYIFVVIVGFFALYLLILRIKKVHF